MRQLQVVGISDDGRLLLLAASAEGRPSHCVELDRRLERAVRGQSLDDGTAQELTLSPKEIQSRLRSGASVEEVAREAGVPIGKVERYAGPVLSEREQVLSAARAGTMTRPRGSDSVLPLGASIEMNLRSLAYARPETAEWSAYRRDEGEWIVRFEVTVRGRRRRAEWAHHPATREVVALNSYALSLGFVETTRRPKAVAPEAGEAKSVKAAKAPAKKAPAKTAAKKVVIGKQVVLVKVPTKTSVKKTTPKKVVAKKTAVSTRKAPAEAAVRTNVRTRNGTKPVARKP